jgi:TIR domain
MVSHKSIRPVTAHFAPEQIFTDIDGIRPGSDFVKTIEKKVSECDVLVALIGERWITSSDGQVAGDSIIQKILFEWRLRREISVIPVLVDGASIPQSPDLPDDLKPLARRNALRVSDTGFNDDCRRLVTAIEEVLEQNAAEKRERDERERLEAEQSTKQHVTDEQRQNELLDAQRREKEILKPALQLMNPYRLRIDDIKARTGSVNAYHYLALQSALVTQPLR